MTRPDGMDRMIDALLGEARAAPPQPSEALMARILAGALAEAPQARAGEPPAAPAGPAARRGPRQGGLLWGLTGGILSGLGGWGAAGGLLTAALAGVWIGASGMATSSAVLGGLLGTSDAGATTIELMSDGGELAGDAAALAQGG
ncbi:MAG: dihydroorotate dehydrogenase [Rhodobacteraceae bacterium]|nr:dihydroorotate dehydrogenase [Paracoccaceae bacterium]